MDVKGCQWMSMDVKGLYRDGIDILKICGILIDVVGRVVIFKLGLIETLCEACSFSKVSNMTPSPELRC